MWDFSVSNSKTSTFSRYANDVAVGDEVFVPLHDKLTTSKVVDIAEIKMQGKVYSLDNHINHVCMCLPGCLSLFVSVCLLLLLNCYS